jgi:hypothetical protein
MDMLSLHPHHLETRCGGPHHLDADARDIAEIERTGVDPVQPHPYLRFEPEVIFAMWRAGEDVDPFGGPRRCR